MNERIRELMLLAQTNAAQETIQNSFGYEGKVFEKFAELIVRECTKEVDQYIRECGGEIGCLPDYVLSQHFGIKE